MRVGRSVFPHADGRWAACCQKSCDKNGTMKYGLVSGIVKRKSEKERSQAFSKRQWGETALFAFIFSSSRPASAPRDVAPHQLDVHRVHLRKFQRILRACSCDALPQRRNILKGDVRMIGPRPALWNQYDLIAARDKYDANDICPGLTGLAQISGRDKLEIDVKVKLDGDYTAPRNQGHGAKMDWRCLWGTVASVIKHDGVVEGGSGEMKKKAEER